MTWKTLAAAVPAAFAIISAPASAAGLTGHYIEARSASVYAGPCHYNGELTTAGREAVLGISVAQGEYAGQRLDGLTVLAAVAGSENLADASAVRRSVVYVPEKATSAQRDALVALLKGRAGRALGEVVAVKAARTEFSLQAKSIKVRAFTQEEEGGKKGGVSLDVSQYPCKHCVMPAQTWYEPFVKGAEVQVAQGISTGFSEKALGVSWRQETADNVFVGTVSL